MNKSVNCYQIFRFEEKNEQIWKEGKQRRYYYPLRPDAECCPFFMKNGHCNYAFNCKFNHPINRRSLIKDMTEEQLDRLGQTECKYYSTSGGCKNGDSCRFNHSGGKIGAAPVLDSNFLGLPIRHGEKECPHYKRHGSCKYGSNCRFNHPDSTSVGGGVPISGYCGSNDTMPCRSSTGSLNENFPLGPHMYQPAQCAPNFEWNGYQKFPLELHEAPVYTSGRCMPRPPAFSMKTPASDANSFPQHQQRVLVEESPGRHGQPECGFKFGFSFQYLKSRSQATSSCTLNDIGLPLRPEKEICPYYGRYGICKHGPACKFDHPVTRRNSDGAAGPEKAQIPAAS